MYPVYFNYSAMDVAIALNQTLAAVAPGSATPETWLAERYEERPAKATMEDVACAPDVAAAAPALIAS